jgi:hypothetical protein
MWNFGLNDFSNLSEFRRLGNSGWLTENPRVGSSILPLGTNNVMLFKGVSHGSD